MRKGLERALSGLPVDRRDAHPHSYCGSPTGTRSTTAWTTAAKSLALVKERGASLRRLLATEIAAALAEPRMQNYHLTLRSGWKAFARTAIDMEVSILARAFGAKWSTWWPKLKPLDKGSEIGKVVTTEDEPEIY